MGLTGYLYIKPIYRINYKNEPVVVTNHPMLTGYLLAVETTVQDTTDLALRFGTGDIPLLYMYRGHQYICCVGQWDVDDVDPRVRVLHNFSAISWWYLGCVSESESPRTVTYLGSPITITIDRLRLKL